MPNVRIEISNSYIKVKGSVYLGLPLVFQHKLPVGFRLDISSIKVIFRGSLSHRPTVPICSLYKPPEELLVDSSYRLILEDFVARRIFGAVGQMP